jgi:hypothetical protein
MTHKSFAIVLAIVGLATLVEAERSAGAQSCGSVGGSSPSFTSDNAYYCATWHDGLHMQDGFMAGNNDWGAGKQPHSQNMTVDPSNFPQNTSWTWTWPTPPQGLGIACCGVDSFYALYWGTAGYAASAGPGAPPPIQLKDIRTLTTSFDLSFSDSALCVSSRYGRWNGNFNIMFDIFLYQKGDPTESRYEPRFEIEISLRDSFPQEFNDHAHYHVTENGHTWTGYQWKAQGSGWDRWWFTTGGNFLSGTVNLNSILQSLVSQGYATGNEWFLGIPLGSEVACGTGGLTINRIHFLLNDLPETGEPR